jgi:hypothetical protein
MDGEVLTSLPDKEQFTYWKREKIHSRTSEPLKYKAVAETNTEY